MTRLRAGRSRVRLPAGELDLSLLQNVQTGSGVLPASFQGVQEAHSPGVERRVVRFFCFVDSASLHNLVNKTNLVLKFS